MGPILFLIFINDLPGCVNCPVCLFADDSKIYCRMPRSNNEDPEEIDDHIILQEDLQELHNWATKWKMAFNVSKCKVMHLGYDNPKHEYRLDGTVLEETVEERDLGVLVDNKLKFENHIKGVVSKANRMLGLIKISFECLNKEMFLSLYKALVRPLLEYCVHAWSPHLQKHKKLLENVQERATKIVREYRHLSYDERLEELELPRLEDRRSRGDMILTYRLINGEEGINYRKFFTLDERPYGLRKQHTKNISRGQEECELRRYLFSKRVIDKWNKLTE